MGFLLELARLRGTETLQNYISDGHDDRLQFLRFLAGSSERLALCIRQASASQSFYRSICKEQWLLTVLTSHDIALKFEADLNIQSNVVPSRHYLTRLKGVMDTCRGQQCSEGFVLTSDICLALEGQLPPSCTNCALAEQLRIGLGDRMAVDELAKVLKFWFLEAKDVVSVKDIKGGSDGEVSLILWRDGTFARKRFHRSEDSHQNTKFDRELDVVLRVSHPNIVHCFGCSRYCSTDCDLFMEVLDEDLESFLSRLEEMVPPLPFTDSLEMLLQVAEAVKHLHENDFIHGDLKPANILMSKLAMPHPDVPFYLVKVTDFGCAQRYQSSRIATMEDFDFNIGSYAYLAPEIKRCRELLNVMKRSPQDLQKIEDFQKAVQKIDLPKIDVFSFGVLADEVVTGVKDAHEGTTLDGDHLSSLEFFKTCKAQEPEDRPSFAEICERLSSSIKINDYGLRKKEAKRKHLDINDEGKNLAKTMKTIMWPAKGTYESQGTS